MRRRLFPALAFVAASLATAVSAQDFAPAPAGTYHVDPQHSRLVFQVNHLGFSNYTAFFREFDAELVFDPAQPEAMQLTATVNPASIETHYPDPAVDFNGILAGPEFLDAAAFPEMTFKSTTIHLTGEKMADVTGDLTMHGVTAPITLQVTFNGGYAGFELDPAPRIGFSAKGSLMRSAYGMGYGIPAPGTTMGVGDEVTFLIETELLNPAAAKPAP